jgi:DNA-binding CsgD family transcriptional regulator
MSRRQKDGTAERQETLPVPDNLPSVPHDREIDRILTAVLRSGEAVVAPMLEGKSRPCAGQAEPEEGADSALPADFSDLLSVLAQIRALLDKDAKLAALIARLPAAFGDGSAVLTLFRNLFPAQLPPKVLDKEGKPILTDRQVEVLRMAHQHPSQQTIARNLSIAPATVKKHFDNIYRALGVNDLILALRRAAALGYLDFDALGSILLAGRQESSLLNRFQVFCLAICLLGPEFRLDEMEPIATFGLFLLMLSGAAARQLDGDRNNPASPGCLCALSAEGAVVRFCQAEAMGPGHDAVVIPGHAAQRGFTPGNVLVVHTFKPQQGLNRGAITEFTPTGQFVRTFCGSDEVGTRLIGPLSLAFAPDGRLLATSGWLTEAVLVFDKGGTVVQRFADGAYIHVRVSVSGRIYAMTRTDFGSVIEELDACGQPLRVCCSTTGTHYECFAVSRHDHLFVERRARFGSDAKDYSLTEEYDPTGRLVRSFSVPDQRFGRFCIDAQGRLYVPNSDIHDLKILTPDGKVLKRFDLSGHLRPSAATIGEDGRLWVCGRVPDKAL